MRNLLESALRSHWLANAADTRALHPCAVLAALQDEDGFKAFAAGGSESAGAELHVRGTNWVWAADIIDTQTGEVWTCWAFELDLFNREIFRWSIKPRTTAETVADSLTRFLFCRKPGGGGVLFHGSPG